MPKSWLQEHKRDYYYRKAKEEKYRSRAAYKLLQVVKKHHFIKEGDVVVDLGAAPGGWIQVARGTMKLNGLELRDGDGAAISDESDIHIEGAEETEFLLFDLS